MNEELCNLSNALRGYPPDGYGEKFYPHDYVVKADDDKWRHAMPEDYKSADDVCQLFCQMPDGELIIANKDTIIHVQAE